MDEKQLSLFYTPGDSKPPGEETPLKKDSSDDKVQETRERFRFIPAAKTAPSSRLFTSDKYSSLNTLEELRGECLTCQSCGLAAGRNSVVFGEGNPEARIMLVGEGPGRNEDETGRPFVGQAGQLLDKILESVGFKREEVFIANVVKCRPPGNRLPTPEESLACRPFLDAQIRLISPWIIICLGALSTQSLIDPKGRITTLRGQWVKKEGFWLIPTYHPAALLRDPSKKRPVWEDFKEIRHRYDAMLGG